MRTLTIFSSVLLLSYIGAAQNEFAVVQLPSRSVENYWVVPDDAGNLCVQYYKRPNLYFEIFDERGEKIKQIQQPFRYQPTIFAGNFSNGLYQFYYEPRSKKKEGDMAVFTIDANELKFGNKIRYDLKAGKSEEFTGHFKTRDALFVFIQIRGSNVIRIAKLNGQPQSEIKNFTAPELLRKAFNIYDPVLFVNHLAPKSIYQFQTLKKAYISDDLIHFTFDHPEQFKTFVWSIDWESGTTELRNIPDRKPVFGKGSNSFLYENKLFRLTVDEVKVDLSVYDLAGRDSVRSFNKTGEGPINFKSGPVTFIDEFATQHTIDNMKNEKLFKTFSNGNPSVFVERINSTNVKVTLGSFNEVATGLTIGGGFGSFGSSTGIAIGGSRQITGTRRGSTFIHSYVTYPVLEISDDINLLTPNERIFQYLDSNRRNIINSKVYSYRPDIIHLAYLDYSEAKLRIIEFRN